MTDQPSLDLPLPSSPRGLGQRIALASAVLSYLCAISCLAGLGLWFGELGGDHPIIASLGASVVFFIGAGIVLHVIGRANLPELGFGSGKTAPSSRTGLRGPGASADRDRGERS